MPHGPDPREFADPEPGLLVELATRGRFGSLPALELAAGELPEAGKETARRSTLDQPPPPFGEEDDDRPDVGPSAPAPARGQRPGVVEFAVGAAGERDRATVAEWAGRPADRLAEFHDRFVEIAGGASWHEGHERGFEAGVHGSLAHIAFFSGPAGRDPKAVRFEGDLAAAERDRGDRSGDVRTDAR